MASGANCPKVKITNSLSYAVDIYDVFNSGNKGESVPFTYTKLATLASGASQDLQTIREASMLQAMYTGTVKRMDERYYYQFPLKVMSAVQFSFTSPPPLEFTITGSDEDAMIQSFLFHRYAMANPNSTLTKNLYTALKTGKASEINDFFKGTKNFTSCTIGSWNAVMSWLQMFTSAWQGPYYLYEKAPNPAPKGYVPTLVATMNIVSSAKENSATLKMCTQDSKGNPVYPDNPQTTTLVMNGDGTIGDGNPGTDVAVSLTPVWMNVIQTKMKDGKPVTTYLSGPTVTGTVANKEVVSSQTARQLPGKPADKKKKSSFDACFNKICQSVGLLVGLIMLGEFAKKIFTTSRDKIKECKKKAASREEFEEEMEAHDPENEPDPEVVQEASDSESQFESDASEVSETYSDTSEAMQEEVMIEIMDDTSESIQEQIQEQMEEGYTPTETFEDSVKEMNDSFNDAREKIADGDFSSASHDLSQASEKMNETIRESGESMEEWESKSLQESSDAVSDAADSSESLDSAQDEYEEDMGEESEDSGFSEEEDSEFPETEEIP